MLPKGGTAWPQLLLVLSLTAAVAITTTATAIAIERDHHGLSSSSSRFHLKRDRPPGLIISSRRSGESPSSPSSSSSLVASASPRRESSFDPDVLNRFLEEYASKIKRTTERPAFGYHDNNNNNDDDDTRIPQDSQDLEVIAIETGDRDNNANITASTTHGFRESARLNDTIKRHKFYGSNSNGEDRNTGWVTLDAIPWSKSKISKWQANPTTQGPWPDSKPWDKPSYNKPWNDVPSRPVSYESNKPWQNKITKPHWSDNSASGSSKPWYSDRPRPIQNDRPSYVDKYDDNPNQAQKWPPERPSWDRYGDQSRPSSDIITDNAPPNFPSWERPGQRPSYTHHMESYINDPGGWNDRNDFSSKYRPSEEGHYPDRPHFSQYQYPSSGSSVSGIVGVSTGGNYPPNHPSTGDGQWVLLSTNRGYSKSRQRSIKLDALVNAETTNRQSQIGSSSSSSSAKKQPPEPVAGDNEDVPAVTSKRQIRLTVLPSINGTNTTTSHGGMLEVERTFKTVEQSQKEYEQEKNSNGTKTRPYGTRILVNKRPIRNTLLNGPVSNSAVLAAVGAGMLPATMAMMIPMMLGRRRRRRSIKSEEPIIDLPLGTLVAQTLRQRRM